MTLIKLQLLLGSASYGLRVNTSDTDLFIVGSGEYIVPEGNKPHIMRSSRELYVQKALLEYKEHPYFLQTLFPAEFMLDTDASEYVLQTREEVIKAQLQKVYKAHVTIGSGMLNKIELSHKVFPKRTAYGIMFLDTVYRYAQGVPFSEAIRPEENFRQWLLSVRNGEISLEEAKTVSAEKRRQAEAVAEFYNHGADQSFLSNWRSEMLSLLEE